MVIEAPSSSSHVSGDTVGTKIPILPEGDGFFRLDHHKLVVAEISHIIRTHLSEGKPSWKKLSSNQRDSFFDLFQKKFSWPPEHKVTVRRNFERRGAAKMSQLLQDVRKDLEYRPGWMGADVWQQLLEHWNSLKFKKASETNKRNRSSMDGASLHTGGSIPHRLHWKRMRKEKGADPSLTEFYFRTHRKKDQSWVGVHAESAYDKFEQKKLEISSQNPTIPGEDEADSQPTNEMPPDLDIWVESVGKKKGNRVFGLGTASKTLVSVSKKPSSLSSDSQEVDVLRSQVHALNASLQRQEQEKMVMRQQLHRQEEKMAEANNKISFLMNHLGFVGSSSHPPQPTNESDHANEDVVDETDEEDLSNEF
ncbi:uncharacterized protein LOC131605272 [Vicia villosa]|uniref:uncharacterized protein LOC131605272 n=1 Tax=Vicia villosa TaxID=3911 RepID=UPI00273B5437|nr:uncharacterized protein LOC131605272 [Vicia villosa]